MGYNILHLGGNLTGPSCGDIEFLPEAALEKMLFGFAETAVLTPHRAPVALLLDLPPGPVVWEEIKGCAVSLMMAPLLVQG